MLVCLARPRLVKVLKIHLPKGMAHMGTVHLIGIPKNPALYYSPGTTFRLNSGADLEIRIRRPSDCKMPFKDIFLQSNFHES